MSANNNYADKNAADRISTIKKDVEAERAGNTSNQNFTPEFLIPLQDDMTISDSISVDNNRVAGGLSDGVNASDQISVLNLPILFCCAGGRLQTFRRPVNAGRQRWFAGNPARGRETLYCGYGACG